MYINSISAIKMGSQSKHLKPPNATGTLKNRASARNRTRADGRRETRIALVARARERERGSPTVQLLWDQPSSSRRPRPPSQQKHTRAEQTKHSDRVSPAIELTSSSDMTHNLCFKVQNCYIIGYRHLSSIKKTPLVQ